MCLSPPIEEKFQRPIRSSKEFCGSTPEFGLACNVHCSAWHAGMLNQDDLNLLAQVHLETRARELCTIGPLCGAHALRTHAC